MSDAAAGPPRWVADAVFYSIIPDRFAPPSEASLAPFAREAYAAWNAPPTVRDYRGGTLWGIIDRLDWLVELGVNALFLTPILNGPTYHHYKPIDHFSVDPLLGGDEAWEALLAAAERRGLRVVFDGVFNHVSMGFRPFVDVIEYGERSPYRDWFRIHSFPVNPFDPSGRPSFDCWNNNPTMPALNHDNPAVWAFVTDVAEHWARRGIDGWRFDAAAEMGPIHDRWRELCARLRAINPDLYLLGEVWTDPAAWLDGTQWDGVTNYRYAFTCRELAGGASLQLRHRLAGQGSAAHVDAAEYARRVEELLGWHPWPVTLAQLNFVDNHDIARLITAVGGDAARTALAELLLFTYPGPPSVFYGQEVGLRGGLPPDCRRGYPAEGEWDGATLARHRQLIALRHGHTALRRGAYRTLHADERLYVLVRWDERESLVVAVNAGTEAARADLALSDVPGRFEPPLATVYGDVEIEVDGDRFRLVLAPLSGGIITTAQATRPVARQRVERESTTAHDVVVVGNIGIDTNVYLPPGYDGPSGESTFTDNQDVIGQAGGYCAFGFASLGRATGFVGYVGADPLGQWIERELRRASVAPLLVVDPAGTSRSINLMREDGTRKNFYDGKAHMTLEPDLGRCERFLASARLVHTHLANWARRLLPIAQRLGIPISCDLQDLGSPDDPYRRDFIMAADVVFFSSVNVGSPERVADALLEMRPSLVIVVGMGSAGAGMATASTGFRRFPPVHLDRPIVDTNGAGDSLAVGFLTAHLLEARPLEEALRWGQYAARHACTLRGGWRSLVTRAELMRYLG